MRTNLEVFHDVAVQPLESQSRCLVLCVFVCFVLAALCLVGLLTYSAGLQPCCYGLFLFFGVLLVSSLYAGCPWGRRVRSVRLDAFLFSLQSWGGHRCLLQTCLRKHACCKLGTLASKLGRWPPTSSDGLYCNFNFTCTVSLGVFSLRLACGTTVQSVRISVSVPLLVRARDEPSPRLW